MLGMFPFIVIVDAIYFIYHQSPGIFLGLGAVHLFLYGLLNWAGALVLYRPIDRWFAGGKEAGPRVESLAWFSSLWILFIGSLYTAIALIPLYFFPGIFKNPDNFVVERIPPQFFFFSILPGIYFIYALFPAFIAYFLINDFVLDLKEAVFARFRVLFRAGGQGVGRVLFLVLLFLVFLPSLLVILELKIAFQVEDRYAQFTRLSPLETVLIDRFIVFTGTIVAAVLITRNFTKPIRSLIRAINQVREGDYSTQAAVISRDEIGIVTHEFNTMVQGLKERELIRDTFGRYVTPDVASLVLKQDLHLEGEMRNCTILVTDIADYTTIAEALTPGEIVLMLNEYFSEIVKIIHEHQGIVNKFIGDSVFAMFNVPLDDSQHASHAIRAALAIQRVTSSRSFGRNRMLTTRIGINTGIVVAGNIGSSERMEYTVIGDDVNIAARLEQMNKAHGTSILIGENTYELTKTEFSFNGLGEIQLKGKEKSIQVYSVIDR